MFRCVTKAAPARHPTFCPEDAESDIQCLSSAMTRVFDGRWIDQFEVASERCDPLTLFTATYIPKPSEALGHPLPVVLTCMKSTNALHVCRTNSFPVSTHAEAPPSSFDSVTGKRGKARLPFF